MNAAALLDGLHKRGAHITANGDRLKVIASPDVLTPKVLSAIQAVKPELLALLSTPEPPPRDGATWDCRRKVWRWRCWIMRTPLSIQLERDARHSEVMTLPEIYPDPATAKSTFVPKLV
jgi:hypothetical protein